jgi:hypothetical protein
MDWFLTTATDGRPAPAPIGDLAPAPAPGTEPGTEPARGTGQPRHMAPRGDPNRLDLAVARVIELQAEAVMTGAQVAALCADSDRLGSGAVLPGGSPAWLSADLDVLVQFVRLAVAAGVILPDGVAGAPSAGLTEPVAHLAAVRDCYRELIDVLSRMSVADEVQATCRDDALRLLRQVERRVHHLDDEHPGRTASPRRGVYDRDFIPGELLG